MSATTEQVTAAADWQIGNRCPWNGCPSICVHAGGHGYVLRPYTPLICDACNVMWTLQDAHDQLVQRGRKPTTPKGAE